MSTITKELAKLFRKITNSEIDAEGNAHVVLSPADSLLINNARIALASLEAEPVAFRIRLKAPWSCGAKWDYVEHREPDRFELENCDIERLYAAPQSAPVVKLPTTTLWAGTIESYEKSDVVTAIRAVGVEVSND